MISGLKSAQIRFAPDRYGMPKATWQIAAVYIVLGPLYYLVSLTTFAEPQLLFDFKAAPLAAAIGWATVLGLASFHIVALALTLARRATGAALGIIGFGMVTPMVSAVAIAWVPIGSGAMLLATLLLIAWTLHRIRTITASVTQAQITAIAAERFLSEEGKLLLIPASAREGKTAVNNALDSKSGFVATIAEYGGAILVVIFGPVLLPLTITGGLGGASVGGGALPILVWFFSVAIFLAARQSICVWAVLARAGQQARAAQ